MPSGGMIKSLFGLLLSIAAVSRAEGATFLQDYSNPTNGTSLTAGLVPDASRVMVGEPLFLTFMVSNRAAQPFQFALTFNDPQPGLKHGYRITMRYTCTASGAKLSRNAPSALRRVRPSSTTSTLASAGRPATLMVASAGFRRSS